MLQGLEALGRGVGSLGRRSHGGDQLARFTWCRVRVGVLGGDLDADADADAGAGASLCPPAWTAPGRRLGAGLVGGPWRR